jgi:hypothetical protein
VINSDTIIGASGTAMKFNADIVGLCDAGAVRAGGPWAFRVRAVEVMTGTARQWSRAKFRRKIPKKLKPLWDDQGAQLSEVVSLAPPGGEYGSPCRSSPWKIANWQTTPQQIAFAVLSTGGSSWSISVTYEDPTGVYPSPVICPA